MTKERKIKSITVLVNMAAVICLVTSGALFLSGSTYTAHPEAMLPMEAWEYGGWALTLGLLPMIIANTMAFLYAFRKGAALPVRLVSYLPAAAESILAILFFVFSLG